MTTPEERRAVQLNAVALPVQLSVSAVYDRLLMYFDEHEPAVADAIRYGFHPTPIEADIGDEGWTINYPPDHPEA